MKKSTPIVLAGACYLALGAGSALAHVTFEAAEAPVGSTYKAVLRIPHGCAGKPTTEIRVKIPEGFINAKPMPKPGWKLSTAVGSYGHPHELHGRPMTEGVQEISWSGGDLADGWYDEFVFRGSFAGDLEPGAVFYFPTLQVCGDLNEPWIDTSGAAGAEHPAPGVTLTPSAHGH